MAAQGHVMPTGPLLTPFGEAREPPPRSVWKRVFRRADSAGARAAISALLNSHGPKQVSTTQLADALLSYGVGGHEARALLRNIWADALSQFLADDVMSDDECSYMEALTRLFDIGYDEVEELFAGIVHPRFGRAVSEAVADGVVTEEERARLTTLASQLRIAEVDARRLFGEGAQATLQAFLQEILVDHRLSPAEEAEWLKRLATTGIRPEYDDATVAHMKRCTDLWRIENGELPEVFASINLQRGEICRLATSAEWHEMRSRTVRVNYSGPVARIRIAKGLYYRVGSIAPQRIQTEELKRISGGNLYVTNKRVILDGDARNMTVRLSSLIAVEVYSDGLILEKVNGRSPHLLEIPDAEYAGAVLTAALAAG
jgi:hypothetical protein